MKIFLIRQVGGTRGRGVGQNFGNVGNPKPTTVFGVQTTVEHRAGSLLAYAVEYATVEISSVEELISTLDNNHWTAYPARETDGAGNLKNGSWIIPSGNRSEWRGLSMDTWNENHLAARSAAIKEIKQAFLQYQAGKQF